MNYKNKFPKDIALKTYSELKKRRVVPPKKSVLINLFEILYFTSLKTEEADHVTFDIVYLNPEYIDSNRPGKIHRDHWEFIALKDPIPLRIASLVKVAKATDFRSSALVVCDKDSLGLCICGFIDQRHGPYNFLHHHADSGDPHPGVFHASIRGLGRIIVSVGLDKIVEFNVNTLYGSTKDIFLCNGPIKNILNEGISLYLSRVRKNLPENIDKNLVLTSYLKYKWISVILRLLMRVQDFGHGGSILITPDKSFSGINLKYEMLYSRLKSSLEDGGGLIYKNVYYDQLIWDEDYGYVSDNISMELHLDIVINDENIRAYNKEIDDAICFVSLLTRVDGVVLMNEELEVQGFGAEVTYSDIPLAVYNSKTINPSDKSLLRIDYNHFGTRHRSIMRYCHKVPGSIGFVVSQDGELRAITKVGDNVVVWDNINLTVR